MPTTSNGFRYPDTSNPPDVAGDIFNLATDVNGLADRVTGLVRQGDWSPQLGGTQVGMGNGANLFASYSKVGREIVLHGFMQFGSGGSFGTGRAAIANIPYGMDALRSTGHGDFYRQNSNGAGVALALVPTTGNTFEIRPIKNLDLGLGYDLGAPNSGDYIRFTIFGPLA